MLLTKKKKKKKRKEGREKERKAKGRTVRSRSPSCRAIQSPPRDSIVNGLSRIFPEILGANMGT